MKKFFVATFLAVFCAVSFSGCIIADTRGGGNQSGVNKERKGAVKGDRSYRSERGHARHRR